MKTDINLLPSKEKKILIPIAKASLVLIFILGLSLFLYINVIKPLEERHRLENALLLLQEKVPSSDKFSLRETEANEKYERWKKKVAALEGIDKSSVPWVSILEEMENIMPQDVSIQSLHYEGMSLELSGTYKDETDAANFLAGLKGMKDFESIWMESMIYRPENKNKAFVIRCQLHGAEPGADSYTNQDGQGEENE